MKEIVLKSPAKINLALDLLYKRIDGFHEIDTIMAKTDLSDYIHIREDNRLEVNCKNVGMEDNLIYKAVKNLEYLTKKTFKYNIEVDKNIPIGAGLAGGSSNAGIVLGFLGKKYNISQNILYKAGEMTGSDVNFFIYEGSFARCTGKGEIIIPMDLKISREFLIVKPQIHSSTPTVYKEFVIEKKESSNNINNIVYNLYKGTMVENCGIFNVLEKPAFKLYNKIRECYVLLNDRFEFVRMSGSGASFFVFDKDIDVFFEKEKYFCRKTRFL